LITQYFPVWAFDQKDLFPGHEQISLLIAIELLTIPTPTTALPFLNVGMCALLHPTLLDRVYPFGLMKMFSSRRFREFGIGVLNTNRFLLPSPRYSGEKGWG